MRCESPGVNAPGCLQVSKEAKKSLQGQRWSQQQGSFRMSAPYSAACELYLSRDTVWRGHNPFFHHKRHRLFQFPEECGAGVWVSSKFIALSSLSSPSQLGGGWRMGLTNRFESCNLLKMLMRKRRAPGSIKMLTWLGMCLNLCRRMWHIYQAIVHTCWVSLKMQQVHELLV